MQIRNHFGNCQLASDNMIEQDHGEKIVNLNNYKVIQQLGIIQVITTNLLTIQ